MPIVHALVENRLQDSFRARQVAGMFDLPDDAGTRAEFAAEIPSLDEPWNIGVIVGPSGSGKTTIARKAFGDRLATRWEWPSDRSLLDGFPRGMSTSAITRLLGSVGFGSPPAWLRPFHLLSNGEQFRVNVARTLAEASMNSAQGMPEVAVIDEFTSVVDRTVAKIGSAAISRAVRRSNRRFVAVTCHYDVLAWLEPDWVVDMGKAEVRRPNAELSAEAAADMAIPPRRWLRRPRIELEIIRCDASAWNVFKRYHYLTGRLHHSAHCFVGLVRLGKTDRPDADPRSPEGDGSYSAFLRSRRRSTFSLAEGDGRYSAIGGAGGAAAAFVAVLPFPHPVRPGWREHRCVCLPDFQGVGIGNRLSEFVASMFAATGKPYRSVTGHPGMIWHRAGSGVWRMTRGPGRVNRVEAGGEFGRLEGTSSRRRVTASFEYVGEARVEEARGFGLLGSPMKYLRAGTQALPKLGSVSATG